MRARPTREAVARTFNQLRAFYRNLAMSDQTTMRAIEAEYVETKQEASKQTDNRKIAEGEKQ